ncbi:MAG: aspartate carbamoyltransferase, partial [Campylobacterales bacterium]
GVIALRTQVERHKSPTFASLHDFAVLFQINETRLNRRDLVILHPGPVNRNVELSDGVVDGPNSLILEQVRNGVAVRMGVLKYLLTEAPNVSVSD